MTFFKMTSVSLYVDVVQDNVSFCFVLIKPYKIGI